MTQKQKILGSIALLFLLIAIVISAAPSGFLQRTSSSAGSYAPSPMMDGFVVSDALSTNSRTEIMRSLDTSAVESAPTSMMDGSGTTFGEKVIKNGSLSLQVATIDEAVNSIGTIAKAHGGTVTNQSTTQFNTASPRESTLSLRVAADQFDAAMSDIKKIAQEVVYETISTNDVTSTYVDLEARLKNAYAEEASYVTVLAKATSVEDILKVQSYLSQVRGEIESMEAQKTYLDSQTAYSTIEVTMSEDAKVTFSDDTFRPWQTIVDAVQTVVEGFQNFILVMIRVGIVGGAIVVPIGLLGLVGRIIWRRVRK